VCVVEGGPCSIRSGITQDRERWSGKLYIPLAAGANGILRLGRPDIGYEQGYVTMDPLTMLTVTTCVELQDLCIEWVEGNKKGNRKFEAQQVCGGQTDFTTSLKSHHVINRISALEYDYHTCGT